MAVADEILKDFEVEYRTRQGQIDAFDPPSSPLLLRVPIYKSANGFRFKLRGRFDFAVSDVSYPGGVLDDGPATARFRRARTGFEGDFENGVNFRAEFDFADGNVRTIDALVNWRPRLADGKLGRIDLTIGHALPHTTVEQMTSARFSSFPERNFANAPFGNGRRTGISATWISPDFRFRWANGIYTDSVNNRISSDEYTVATRMIYEPRFGDWQLHAGVNAQTRKISRDDRLRNYAPGLSATNVRTQLISSGTLDVGREQIFGLEIVAQRGPVHFVAEAQQLRLSDVRDPVTGEALPSNPRFRTGYAEAGWWVTGERRGFDNGAFGRTATRRPLGRGGFGGLSLNFRHDRIDVQDRRAGIDGGLQFAWAGSVVWQQNNFTRTWLSFARGMAVDGATGHRQPFNALTLRFGLDY